MSNAVEPSDPAVNRGNWGECYFDHFTRYFGMPVGRETYQPNAAAPVIQILKYDGVFSGCRVFCSLGATHYSAELHGIAEVLVVVDSGWDDSAFLLANVLFQLIQKPLALRPGIVVSRLEKVRPGFVAQYQKVALYFTTLGTLYTLPKEFAQVGCKGKEGALYVGYFISAAELAYWEKHEPKQFQQMLQSKHVDLLHLARPSSI